MFKVMVHRCRTPGCQGVIGANHPNSNCGICNASIYTYRCGNPKCGAALPGCVPCPHCKTNHPTLRCTPKKIPLEVVQNELREKEQKEKKEQERKELEEFINKQLEQDRKDDEEQERRRRQEIQQQYYPPPPYPAPIPKPVPIAKPRKKKRPFIPIVVCVLLIGGGILGRGYFFNNSLSGEWVEEEYADRLEECAGGYLQFINGMMCTSATPEFCRETGFGRRQTRGGLGLYETKGGTLIWHGNISLGTFLEFTYKFEGGKLYITDEYGETSVYVKYKGIGWPPEEKDPSNVWFTR